MPLERFDNALSRVQLALALTPLASVALFYSYVVRARVALGRWPLPYRPDPKDLGFDLHRGLVAAGIDVVFAAAVPTALFAVVVYFMPSQRRRVWAFAVLYLVLLAAWFLLLWTDPGRFVEWYFD